VIIGKKVFSTIKTTNLSACEINGVPSADLVFNDSDIILYQNVEFDSHVNITGDVIVKEGYVNDMILVQNLFTSESQFQGTMVVKSK